jgi:hypothetical protein
MLHESVQHFKAVSMKKTTLVIKEKTETALLDGKLQLPLSCTTGITISSVGGQRAIGVATGEFRHLQVEVDLFQRI